jgi:class 3 adenylate cyclase
LGKDLSTPVHAAVELASRLKQVGRDLDGGDLKGLRVSIGLHVGQILVLNVGGQRFMIQTVVGEATRVAEALLEVAGEGMILATRELVEAAGDGIAFREGPDLAIPGQAQIVKTFCLISSPMPVYPSDPATLVTKRQPE